MSHFEVMTKYANNLKNGISLYSYRMLSVLKTMSRKLKQYDCH